MSGPSSPISMSSVIAIISVSLPSSVLRRDPPSSRFPGPLCLKCLLISILSVLFSLFEGCDTRLSCSECSLSFLGCFLMLIDCSLRCTGVALLLSQLLLSTRQVSLRNLLSSTSVFLSSQKAVSFDVSFRTC